MEIETRPPGYAPESQMTPSEEIALGNDKPEHCVREVHPTAPKPLPDDLTWISPDPHVI